MFTNKLYTPLRYPGGKARFAPFLARIIEENSLHGGHYVEPYAGGAGAALELLFHGHVSEIHINDADPAVYLFWKAAVHQTDALIELIENTPISMDEWYRWRDVMLAPSGHSTLERGFATLFMNRTNRSGILKGGVVGGYDQEGTYRLDARFKKNVIIERLLMLSGFRKQIHVYGRDALVTLAMTRKKLPERSFLFLDPPYYVKGRGLYRNFYSHTDHARVAETLRSDVRSPWIVSYDDTPQIRQLYSSWRRANYRLHYTAQIQHSGSEVMFFSHQLKLPRRRSAMLRRTAAVN